MTTRRHVHEESFPITPEELFALLHTPSAVLRVSQDGFPIGPEADAFYAACEQGWRDTFAGIRRFVSGPARPNEPLES